MDTENPWKLLSTAIVYKNRWMAVREDKAITPTGANGLYAYVESNESVTIVALNNKDEIYLLKRYVYPQHKWMWGLVGGGGDKEKPLVASKRELEEETGILAKTWDKLGETTVCNGFMTERMVTYLARDLSFSGEKEHSDEKIMDAKFVSQLELASMIRSGEFYDGQALAALHLLSIWRGAKH